MRDFCTESVSRLFIARRGVGWGRVAWLTRGRSQSALEGRRADRGMEG